MRLGSNERRGKKKTPKLLGGKPKPSIGEFPRASKPERERGTSEGDVEPDRPDHRSPKYSSTHKEIAFWPPSTGGDWTKKNTFTSPDGPPRTDDKVLVAQSRNNKAQTTVSAAPREIEFEPPPTLAHQKEITITPTTMPKKQTADEIVFAPSPIQTGPRQGEITIDRKENVSKSGQKQIALETHKGSTGIQNDVRVDREPQSARFLAEEDASLNAMYDWAARNTSSARQLPKAAREEKQGLTTLGTGKAVNSSSKRLQKEIALEVPVERQHNSAQPLVSEGESSTLEAMYARYGSRSTPLQTQKTAAGMSNTATQSNKIGELSPIKPAHVQHEFRTEKHQKPTKSPFSAGDEHGTSTGVTTQWNDWYVHQRELKEQDRKGRLDAEQRLHNYRARDVTMPETILPGAQFEAAAGMPYSAAKQDRDSPLSNEKLDATIREKEKSLDAVHHSVPQSCRYVEPQDTVETGAKDATKREKEESRGDTQQTVPRYLLSTESQHTVETSIDDEHHEVDMPHVTKSLETSTDESEFSKYFKMLRLGVPMRAVKTEVWLDGYKPAVLDNYRYRRLKWRTAASDDWKDIWEGELEKFYKMLSAGVPLEAVQHRMQLEGWDPSTLDCERYQESMKHAARVATDGEYEGGGDDPEFAKYFDMMIEGVNTLRVVKEQMERDGLDPDVLDLYQYERVHEHCEDVTKRSAKTGCKEDGDTGYTTYFRMLAVGVPMRSVKHQMSFDGLEPADLDNYQYERLKWSTGAADQGDDIWRGEHAKYYKMLTAGVPIEAVQQRMQLDGYDPATLNFDLYQKTQRHNARAAKAGGRDEPAYFAKYFDMLDNGVIFKDVKQQMEQDGFDPDVLDHYQYRRIRGDRTWDAGEGNEDDESQYEMECSMPIRSVATAEKAVEKKAASPEVKTQEDGSDEKVKLYDTLEGVELQEASRKMSKQLLLYDSYEEIEVIKGTSIVRDS